MTGAIRALSGARPARRDGVRAYIVPARYLMLAADQMGLPGWEIERALDKMAGGGAGGK